LAGELDALAVHGQRLQPGARGQGLGQLAQHRQGRNAALLGGPERAEHAPLPPELLGQRVDRLRLGLQPADLLGDASEVSLLPHHVDERHAQAQERDDRDHGRGHELAARRGPGPRRGGQQVQGRTPALRGDRQREQARARVVLGQGRDERQGEGGEGRRGRGDVQRDGQVVPPGLGIVAGWAGEPHQVGATPAHHGQASPDLALQLGRIRRAHLPAREQRAAVEEEQIGHAVVPVRPHRAAGGERAW
jgi:hypothetical protein